MTLSVDIIPVLHNNYAFLICNNETGKAVAVDPGEAAPIAQKLDEKNLDLEQIWLTHYHYDHCDGAPELSQKYDCPVYGPENPPKNFTVEMIDSSKKLEFSGETFHIMETPGHVPNHVSFYNASNRMLFPGDTLFAGGAAVVINDKASRLWQTMQKLRILPDGTRVYFSHEVTARNIRFALSLDPENDALKLRYNFTKAQLKRKQATCPSMLQMEKETNPFLRADDPEFQKVLGMENKSGDDVFVFLMNKLDQSYGRS